MEMNFHRKVDEGRRGLLYNYLRVSKNTNLGGNRICWTIKCSDGPLVHEISN